MMPHAEPARSEPISRLPFEGFVRLTEILSVIPVSRATWWRGVQAGSFPRPFKLGRASLWRVEDIRGLIAKISGEVQS